MEKIPHPKQVKTDEYHPIGRYPVVSQEEKTIAGYSDLTEYVYQPPKPVIIFGDHTRVLKYVDFDFIVGADGVKILIPKDGLQTKFLYYYLKWYKIPNLGYSRHFKLLKEINVPVPPLPVQQRIVSELDQLSDIIAMKRKQVEEYNKLTQSLFYEMFSSVKGETVKLGDVVTVVSGLVDPKEPPFCNQPHISPANIMSGSGELYGYNLAKDDKLISGKYSFDETMVLYSKIRPKLNKVAIPNFKGICSADMYPLIPKSTIDRFFLRQLLSNKDFLEYAIKRSGRARMPKLNREALLDYHFPLPPLPLQHAFAAKVRAIEHQKQLVNDSIRELQTLLDSRMQEYFG